MFATGTVSHEAPVRQVCAHTDVLRHGERSLAGGVCLSRIVRRSLRPVV